YFHAVKREWFLSISLIFVLLQGLLLLNVKDIDSELKAYQVNFVTSCTQSAMKSRHDAAVNPLGSEDRLKIARESSDYCFCMFRNIQERGILVKETFKDSVSADLLLDKYLESDDGKKAILK